MPNRLAQSTSTYLQQHKDNPVDWWEWGPEAFAEATRRDVPVLLSVGYAACHWCHVMAHESFEDDAVAASMNERFVCVKVDRQERPDVDEVYMRATVAMTGAGGWPMTVMLTPQGDPFHAGTYYPPAGRHGMISFPQLLDGIHDAWTNRRGEVLEVATDVRRHLEQPRSGSGDVRASDRQTADALDPTNAALRSLLRQEDREHGGFGAAPKFPPSTVLEFLRRRSCFPDDLAVEAALLAGRTLRALAVSGMADQLAGGFARYSVDVGWVVPHFEKMLYDNAQLLRAFALAAHEDSLFRRAAIGTADFLLTELQTEQGLFAAALDADTQGVEGSTYVWTPEQLRERLGDEDADYAAAMFAVTPAGTFEHGSSTLQLAGDPEHDPERFERVRASLLDMRRRRPQPDRDDLVVTGWNGLAVGALVLAGTLLGEPALVDAASRAAESLLGLHEPEPGRLVHSSRAGSAGTAPGTLEDYAYLADGLLTLHAATGSEWAAASALRLVEAVLERFDDGAGGIRDTDRDAESLYVEHRQDTDNATPAGRFVFADVLVTIGALTGRLDLRERASRLIEPALSLSDRAPQAVGWALAAQCRLAAGPPEVAVVGPPDLRRQDLLTHALRDPRACVATGPGDVGTDHPVLPLLEHRSVAADGGPLAYVCRDFTCSAPVSDARQLTEQLSAR
jgi:uncharacterized protein YyaL (SSP411 family)